MELQWFTDEEDTDCWATWESHLQLFESAVIQGLCSQAFLAWKILIHFLNTSKYLIHRWQKPRRVFFPCFLFLLIFYLICFVIQRLCLTHHFSHKKKKKKKKRTRKDCLPCNWFGKFTYGRSFGKCQIMATLKFVAIKMIQMVVYPMVVILIVRIVIVRLPWFCINCVNRQLYKGWLGQQERQHIPIP